jgi:LPS-assembly protein
MQPPDAFCHTPNPSFPPRPSGLASVTATRLGLTLLLAASLAPVWALNPNTTANSTANTAPNTASTAGDCATHPDQGQATDAPVTVAPVPPAPRTLTIEASSSDSEIDGKTRLHGPVVIHFGNQTVRTGDAEYAQPTQQVDAKSDLTYQNGQMTILSSGGHWNPNGEGEFNNTHFELPARNARGSAKQIRLQGEQRAILSDVNYSTCPIDRRDWVLKADTVKLDQSTQTATATHAHLNVAGLPLLYLPYIQFPIGEQRKSGFLFPVIGQSNTSGLQLQAPYYFNLAPNADLTLAPGYSTKRGVTLNESMHYLGARSATELKIDWLPHDQVANSQRINVRFDHTSDLTERLHWVINTPYVSDSKYFQDFGGGTESTSVTYLDRNIQLDYLDKHWLIRGLIDQFQTIDLSVAPADRPAARIPAISVYGHFGQAQGWRVDLNAEADVFNKNIGTDGARLRLDPSLRFATNLSGIQLSQTVGYSLLNYQLRNPLANQPTHLLASAPFMRLESSVLLEKISQQLITQLEPKLLYAYSPYRAQDNFPVFDSGIADLNAVELFRGARFQGHDRIEDLNQLSLGANIRELDQSTGQQWLSATVGQILYFTRPKVSLPLASATDFAQPLLRQAPTLYNPGSALGANPLNPVIPDWSDGADGYLRPPGGIGYFQGLGPNGLPNDVAYGLSNGERPYAPNALPASALTPVTPIPSSALPAGNSSDLVGQLDLTGPHHLNFTLGELWDPHQKLSTLNEARVSFSPAHDKVVNLSYRYRRGLLEQVEGAFAWPLGPRWALFARDVYSLKEHTQIDSFSGFQYQACCFKVELLTRHYVSSFDGSRNTSIVFQVELNGLSTVSDRVGAFLEQTIRGYSPSSNLVSR